MSALAPGERVFLARISARSSQRMIADDFTTTPGAGLLDFEAG
jgi:hypothetical protein